MWTASQISAIELVDALECNGTTFLVVKPFGNFFPRLTLPPLLADEYDMGFKPAVERQAAASLHPYRVRRAACSFGIHRQQDYGQPPPVR